MEIVTKYNLKERVHIIELGINGVVTGFFIDDFGAVGIQYQIMYFKDNEAKIVYFYDFELEPYKEIIKEVGFSIKKV